MLKSRLLRLLCAAMLVVGLAVPTVPLHAAPLELPSIDTFIAWLFGGLDVEGSSPATATGSSEIHPTADPNGPSSELTTTDSGQNSESLPGNEGEIYPTADPNG